MAIMYNQQNVDEKYSPILEPNLYYGSIFIPGITCSDEYEIGPAGGIFVHKLDTTECEPGTPGRDFEDEESKDELIPIVMNNNFLRSKKFVEYRLQQSVFLLEMKGFPAQLARLTKEDRQAVLLA